jgi:HEAT repeat protein
MRHSQQLYHGEALRELLRGERVPTVGASAARALGKLPDSLDSLIALLKDDTADMRRIAAEELGNIGDRRAVAPLIAALWGEQLSVRMLPGSWPEPEVFRRRKEVSVDVQAR